MFLFENLFQQLCKACNFNCHIEIEGLFEVKGSHVHHTSGQGPSVNNESLSHIPFYSIFNKLPVISNMVLCFVYGCNHNSLWESCKFYRFRIRAVYTCAQPCTRSCTRPIHGRVHGPVNGCVHGCVHGPWTQPCTRRVHGRVHVYTCTRPCTLPCMYSDMYRVVHVTRSCTRPCTGRVTYTAQPCGRPRYTAMYGPCTLNNN